MRVVSADWVVPVEGEPIAEGAVAIADDGRIAAVGPRGELGEGERFDGCVITPGFVNCHSHLEYAVYAGFGDGLAFPAWIAIHVERKQKLELDDMRAIATDGAFASLRSGITTVGDCSFAGAAAEAAAATGLRAIVYVEAFSLGAPVIHADTPAYLEVSAASGLAVPVGVDGAFADRLAMAITRVVEDRELAGRLAVTGQDRARAYSWRDSAERVWLLHADL